jgi:hypothetical protein
MAETATTRPARRRATTTAKTETAPAKAAPKTEVADAASAKTEVTRFTVELEHGGTTKSYEKFVMPDGYKGTTVGTIYAPLGTERVAVLIVGPGDSGAPAHSE